MNCTFCGNPSYLGPIHPCCRRALLADESRCEACAASKKLNAQYERLQRYLDSLRGDD